METDAGARARADGFQEQLDALRMELTDVKTEVGKHRLMLSAEDCAGHTRNLKSLKAAEANAQVTLAMIQVRERLRGCRTPGVHVH
jgi:hypothetical protein